jgi:hypothetical protein
MPVDLGKNPIPHPGDAHWQGTEIGVAVPGDLWNRVGA